MKFISKKSQLHNQNIIRPTECPPSYLQSQSKKCHISIETKTYHEDSRLQGFCLIIINNLLISKFLPWNWIRNKSIFSKSCHIFSWISTSTGIHRGIGAIRTKFLFRQRKWVITSSKLHVWKANIKQKNRKVIFAKHVKWKREAAYNSKVGQPCVD